MKFRTIRKYLHNLDGLKEDIKNLKKTIGDLETNIDYSVTSVITGMPKPSGVSRKVESVAIKRTKKMDKLKKELEDKIIINRAIEKVKAYLNPIEKEAIYLRYFDKVQGRKNNTWSRIAEKMHYDVRWIHIIERQVIIKIQTEYNNLYDL